MVIPVAHDFRCPWCWIALFQVADLKREFGVEVEWLAYDMMPAEVPWPDPAPQIERPVTDRPPTPTRLELAYAAQNLEAPTAERPKRMRSHNCHEAVELAKETGVQDIVVDRLYRAYWERGEEIGALSVLLDLTGDLLDPHELESTIAERRYADRIIGFDAPAYASGVYYVPTFFIGGIRYAEQPIQVLRKALRATIAN